MNTTLGSDGTSSLPLEVGPDSVGDPSTTVCGYGVTDCESEVVESASGDGLVGSGLSRVGRRMRERCRGCRNWRLGRRKLSGGLAVLQEA